MAPPDPIIGLNEAYQKDDSPHKVIIGVGAYRDDTGKPYVLPSVRIAEERMLQQQLDMEYSGIVRYHGVIVLSSLLEDPFLQLDFS
jgi:aspartate aminotransferase, mitochondrial